MSEALVDADRKQLRELEMLQNNIGREISRWGDQIKNKDASGPMNAPLVKKRLRWLKGMDSKLAKMQSDHWDLFFKQR